MSSAKDIRVPKSDAREFKNTVSVSVVNMYGGDVYEVQVSRELLCASSAFFQKATKTKGNLFRGNSKTINVEFQPALFKAYMHWLHYRTIPRPNDDQHDRFDFPYLAELYVLGEELMDVKFKNEIGDTIIAVATKARWNPMGEAVAIIYKGTMASSPARRLMVDLFMVEYCKISRSCRNTKVWTDKLKNSTKDFLVGAIEAILQYNTGASPKYDTLSPQAYHEEEPRFCEYPNSMGI